MYFAIAVLCTLSGLNRLARPNIYLTSLLVIDIALGIMISNVTRMYSTYEVCMIAYIIKDILCLYICCKFDIQTLARKVMACIYGVSISINIVLCIFVELFARAPYINTFIILTILQLVYINCIWENRASYVSYAKSLFVTVPFNDA